MPKETRRDVIKSSGATILGIFDWFDIFGDDDSSSGTNLGPERKAKNYPFQHGTDVDAPADAHHSAGAFLALSSGAMDLDVQEETFTFNMAAASSGTVILDFSGAYDIVGWGVRYPDIAGGGVLTDIAARPTEFGLTNDGLKSGLTLAWNNSDTADHKGKLHINGLTQ